MPSTKLYSFASPPLSPACPLAGLHLDVGSDDLDVPRRECVVLWPLHQLEVTHGSQLQTQVLHGFGAAVDDRDIHDDVVLVHLPYSRGGRGGGGGQQVRSPWYEELYYQI